MTELNQERPESDVPTVLEIIKSLIGKIKNNKQQNQIKQQNKYRTRNINVKPLFSGYFNLDPNRVLDILLETFENRPEDDDLFIPLIKSYMSDRKVLCEVLGFKYCCAASATPFSLQRLTALMLQHGVISLPDILPWLAPSDKVIISDYDQAMKQAKEYVKKMSIISTKDKEDVPEEKENNQVNFTNQKSATKFHYFNVFNLNFFFSGQISNKPKVWLVRSVIRNRSVECCKRTF